jgi:hypothetical protein
MTKHKAAEVTGAKTTSWKKSHKLIRKIADRVMTVVLTRHANSGRIDVTGFLSDSDISENIREFFELTLWSGKDFEKREHEFIEIDEFDQLLHSSVALTYAYLTSPQETLSDVLSGDCPEVVLGDHFFWTLDRFIDYPHLKDILRSWAEAQQAAGIYSASAFVLRTRIAKIDRLVLETSSISTVHDLFASLFTFFALGKKKIELPKEVVRTFLTDRGMTRADEAFTKVKHESFSPDRLERTMREVLSRLLHKNHEHVEIENPIVEEVSTEALEVEAPIETPIPQVNYDAFLDDLRSAGVQMVAPYDLREITDAPSGATLPNIESMISEESRKNFLKKLFLSEQEYTRYCQMINRSQSWKQASVYVDAIFLKNKIDPYSKRAIQFTDIVYARYLSKASLDGSSDRSSISEANL